ncbi:LptA/OstA family protein [Allosphingosinicella indica]|uniref:Lipopolysaccharide export system protein LptA n=1 Tax=Allosphingosinicella indica TaxID=941907 RepID=A0A1X7G9Y5_9SPHN|nr:LptA/OstA family protein [Allosphingosinicella indica]SMF66390.1 lipopolysaccharide export system protein LptA [Allosphingosinicella indica]
MSAVKNSLAGLGALILAGSALAQSGTSALKGHNSNAPVDVAADRIEVQDRADRAIFSGNVVAKQAGLTLNASRVTVAYSSGGGIEIDRLDASGGVTVTSPSETAKGNSAIYDLNRRLITMIGGVTLTQGRNVVRGGRLTIDLDSGRAVVDGGAPAGVNSGGGRVTGTFTVPQRAGANNPGT